MFASQAAAAIVNARTHHDERRARADLEALVETSPVGVVVFDAGTGNPVSFNREARRIAEGLRTPGQPPEQLLEVLTCRFSDEREVALADLPMRQVIGGAATVRAEEVVLSVPDWPEHHAAGQRHPDPFRRRRRRVDGRHPAGPWRRSRSWSGCESSSWAW